MAGLNQVISFIITLCVTAVFIAVLTDFLIYGHKSNTKKSKKSIVETGSMIGFFVIYYLILRFRIGFVPSYNFGFIILGIIIVACGAAVNIIGRIYLRGNWANQIKIYKNHVLVKKGVYSWIRHPLYASIIWMMLGGSLTYRNYMSAILIVFVFIPFMTYRAKQEEELLLVEFREYSEYKIKTGMFFPKFWRALWRNSNR